MTVAPTMTKAPPISHETSAIAMPIAPKRSAEEAIARGM